MGGVEGEEMKESGKEERRLIAHLQPPNLGNHDNMLTQ